MNTTVTGKLLADLGLAYSFSDSGIDSSENDASIEADMGDDTFTAALTVDFVQRCGHGWLSGAYTMGTLFMGKKNSNSNSACLT